MSASKHVPAWKRIGLKLKNSSESNVNDVQPLQTESKPRSDDKVANKKRYIDDADQTNGNKKRKTDYSADSSSTWRQEIPISAVGPGRSYGFGKSQPLVKAATTPKHMKFSFDEEASGGEEDERASHQLTRKKSVTFTPETKVDDGFSAHKLFKAWAAEQSGEETTSEPVEASEAPAQATPTKSSKKTPKPAKAVVSTEAASTDKKPRDKQKKSKAEKKQSNASPAASTHTPPYVQYLEQFHTDKDNWKFNKSKQNDILKNVWNLYRIPAAHNPALLSYIAGLQGLAARKRLIEGGEETLKAILSSDADADAARPMDTPAARLAAYNAALERQIQKYERSGAGRSEQGDTLLEEEKTTIERGQRAELILRTLLINELYPEQASNGPRELDPVAATGSETQTKVKRKRKSRTEVSSDEESSSSSESESESDSSSSEESSDSSDSDSEEETSSDDSESESGDSSSDEGKSKPIFDKNLLDQVFEKKERR